VFIRSEAAMSMLVLRFTPPAESYEGFKFRMASILCVVFGFFATLFFVRHVLVFHSDYTVGVLPEPFRVIGNYLLAYYCRTSSGVLELVLMLAAFGAVFWLNLPKQYFAGHYRDYGKERASAEAKSLTLLLTLMALCLVLFSVPFLTLHFPGWVSWLVKYGPIAAGVLQYVSILPKTSEIERTPAIDKLDWNMRSFDATHRSTPNRAVANELKACSSLMSQLSGEAAGRFLTEGSTTVTWSGFGALFRNLAILLGVSPDSITRRDTASQAIEHALGELLDERRNEATLVLTTDAEHHSVRSLLEDRLKPMYQFNLEVVPVQSLLWSKASTKEAVSTLLDALKEKKPDIAVLSHVFPDTGIVLDLKELIDAAHKENLRTLFVVDGSHAVGNIMVNDEVLGRSAYYAFHGHGWLLGTPSSGILVRNGWLLRVVAGIETGDPADTFASPRQVNLQDMPAAYDDVSSWFALNYVLKHEWLAVGIENATKHTKKLACLFCDEMHKRDVHTIGISAASSAIVISDIPQMKELYHSLELRRLDCRMVTADLGNGERMSGIRFCFHHYHSDDDVRDLAELIGDFKAKADLTRPVPPEPFVIQGSFKQTA
jgi:selenocysteine lyase/cysteine desulfurase